MRFIPLMLALLLLLGSCGGADRGEAADISPVTKAVEAFNGEDVRSTAFALNVSEKGKEESVFFSQGTVNYRRNAPVAMSGRMTQIYKGSATTADIYYKAGAYYRSDKDNKYYLVMERDSFLKQFMCSNLPAVTADKANSVRTAETAAGTKYSLVTELDRDTLTDLFGDSLYSACSLKKPQKDKTAFGKAELSCVVGEDGSLHSLKLTTTATVYDTPPYYPNYSVEEKSLTRSFDLSYEISVKALGDGIEIVVPKTEDFVFLS